MSHFEAPAPVSGLHMQCCDLTPLSDELINRRERNGLLNGAAECY